MSGRVTIACNDCRVSGVKQAATTLNFYGNTQSHVAVACDFHASMLARHRNSNYAWDYYLPLINPGTCTDSDIANVRAAIEAISRICRALWCDDAESRGDLEVMRLCADEVRFTLYQPCDEPGWNFDGGERHVVVHGPDGGETRCLRCHGTGLVLRDDARLDDERRAG